LTYSKESNSYQTTGVTKSYGNISGNNNYSNRYYENGSSLGSNQRGGAGHIKSYQYGAQ